MFQDKAIREQAELSKLSNARDHDRRAVEHWIRNDHGGNEFLEGCEARPWMASELPDLLSLSPRSTDDLFTRWIEECILPWVHWMILHPWKVCNQVQA